MHPKIKKLVDEELGHDCPECGEGMITLPSMKLIREGSVREYNTYYNECLMCNHRTELVKLAQEYVQKVNYESNQKKRSKIKDITPIDQDSLLVRFFIWLSRLI